MILFAAAKNDHELIRKTIAELEAAAADTMELRVIALTHAKPSDMAAAIEEAYGSGGRGRGKQPTGGQFTLTPHDASGRLFVRASEGFFADIEALAKSLDEPRSVPFEFRVYPLQYADAAEVHETVNKLMTDYVRLLPADQRSGMDAFSIDANEQANALVVLGSPLVFGFLEEHLPQIKPLVHKVKGGQRLDIGFDLLRCIVLHEFVFQVGRQLLAGHEGATNRRGQIEATQFLYLGFDGVHGGRDLGIGRGRGGGSGRGNGRRRQGCDGRDPRRCRQRLGRRPAANR